MQLTRIMQAGLVVSLLLLASCGGGTTTSITPPAQVGSAPTSLIMRDTPPAGVTILSFEIDVTAATLASSSSSVPLITGEPIRVEVEHLQVEKAFLSTTPVAAGTYDSIAVSFANPEMTIINNSGADIGSCANGATCELHPTLNPASVTYSGAPFPLTITANQPAGLLLDFNLNDSVQSDLSVAPAISFTQLTAAPKGEENEGEMEEIDDITGQITVVDTTNSQITVQDSSSGQTFSAKVDSSTEIEDFERVGLANSFSSFQVGQIVEVDLRLMSDGTFTAKKVELKQPEGVNENQLDGQVVAIDSSTEFKMVLHDEALDDDGVEIGNILTVTLQDGATFQIDSDGIALPTTVTFLSAADLLVGQNLQIRIPSGSTGTSVTTDQVTLHRSQITGKVTFPGGIVFTVGSLPDYFTNASPTITQIDVQTSSGTQFEGVTDAAGLNVGDPVSVRGLLFKTSANPLLVADSIYKRQPED